MTDGSKMPQMLYAVGFATYDEAGTSLECRHPKASDFKLVFLWKNTTEEEAQGHKQICTEKPKVKTSKWDFEYFYFKSSWGHWN